MCVLAASALRLPLIWCRRSNRYTWDGHIQPAALRRTALGPDASAVAHHDLPADVETETHSRGVTRGTIRRAIEETEDRVELLLGDPDPFVGHGEPHATIVLGTDIDRDRSAAGRVLDRIRHEVVEHLLEMIPIGGHDALRVARERDLVRRGRELHPRGHLVRELAQVDVAVTELDPARLDTRHVEQL